MATSKGIKVTKLMLQNSCKKIHVTKLMSQY